MTPYTISFLLLDGFSMIAFTNLVEPLRIANYLLDTTAYIWQVSGFGEAATQASNALALNHTHAPDALLNADMLIVCGGYDFRHNINPQVRQLINRAAARKLILGGACTGTMALADAGKLNDYAATLHWENLTAAREQYPATHFRQNLFIADRDRLTCSGGTAALDMALHIISSHHEQTLLARIADIFMIEHIRPTAAVQHIPTHIPHGSAHRYLRDAITLMQNTIGEPLSIADVANHVHLSPRQLERLFKQHLNISPRRYYTQLRLEHANKLLQQTDLSITAISIACGFTTSSNFCKSYRKYYNQTPSRQRKNIALF